jgi:nicotinate phosphoribosyltransferase
MAAAYFENGLHHRAVFEMFTRKLPRRRSYLIVAGIQQALEYLSTLCFSGDQIDYLREHSSFKNVSREFFAYLRELRFTGDVWAMPEGTAAFGMEPLLRISAPIIEAQIVETFLLSAINFQTMIASKASRIVSAAAGRDIVEFGTRRAHGTEAGLLAARAAYIAGCAGTSNVEAGHVFGIPTFGTLAHSFVMSFDDEDDAFRAFLNVFPETATVLVDTYDTIAAVKRLARDFGSAIPAVRLDSGDLLELSKQVRQILDDAGMNKTRIFASGDLNEYKIRDLIGSGAAIDSFGVGTELATSFDVPALSGVYKLTAIEENGRMSMRIKLSHDKETYPGPKQVWRFSDQNGNYVRDLIALADENVSDTEPHSSRPLLDLMMEQGRMKGRDNRQQAKQDRWTALSDARNRARGELENLPAELLLLEAEPNYPVGFSERLIEERENLERKLEGLVNS